MLYFVHIMECTNFTFSSLACSNLSCPQDENRYSAGRGTHINLKRAERARIMINKIPGTFFGPKKCLSLPEIIIFLELTSYDFQLWWII